MGVFDFQELISAFIVLFAVIDIIGAVPIILDLKQKGRSVNALEATLIAAGLLLAFFFAGDMILKLFQVDIASFAVAGAFVPLVFPLLAGAGSFTTLLSLRAEYATVNILLALVLNMVWVFIVLKMTGRIERLLGKGGIYIIRKFFGIILLAISVRLFTANLTLLIEQFQHGG